MKVYWCSVRTAREITVSFYTPHPALSPSRGEEDAVNYFSNGPKQIVSERMKLSGMRWKHPGAQHVMTLRSILLSQTWQSTFRCTLLAFPPVTTLCF